jgi:hypothetical protein
MTVFDKEVRSARMSPRYNSARYAHNIYSVNTKTRVFCDPILKEGEQTPRAAEFVKTVGEMTIIFVIGAAIVGSLYTIYSLTSGGA